jgi:hypothetical protein
MFNSRSRERNTRGIMGAHSAFRNTNKSSPSKNITFKENMMKEVQLGEKKLDPGMVYKILSETVNDDYKSK